MANRKYPHTDLICSLAVSPLTILLFQAQKLLNYCTRLANLWRTPKQLLHDSLGNKGLRKRSAQLPSYIQLVLVLSLMVFYLEIMRYQLSTLKFSTCKSQLFYSWYILYYRWYGKHLTTFKSLFHTCLGV